MANLHVSRPPEVGFAGLRELGGGSRPGSDYGGSIRSSNYGNKIRVNVIALLGDGVVGKLLVPVDEDALISDLASKTRGYLVKAGIVGHLLRLTNEHQAHLPGDEHVGECLRDGDQVYAVLTQEPQEAVGRRQRPSGAANVMNFVAPNPQVEPPEFHQSSARPEPTQCIPGPQEVFEDEIREECGRPPRPGAGTAEVGPAIGGRPPQSCDWSVEGLTGKLREYISTRFMDSHQAVADPGQSYITVTMRPHERFGATGSVQPVHYSIARIDIIEFERLCRGKIQEIRWQLDYFNRSYEALNSMAAKGASMDDYAPNMMPYRYRAGGEVDHLLNEADGPAFGQVEGHRPVIVIDTSGAVGEKLRIVKEALKRMLYSFLVAKSKFNLVRFRADGRADSWMPAPAAPSAEKLREAEDWLAQMRPVRAGCNLVDGLHHALAPAEVDVVYVLTSGLSQRCNVDYALKDIRGRNIRDLPIHVIGIDCEARAELDLRRLAQENSGTFRQKRFDDQLVGWGTSSSSASRQPSGDKDDARVSIRGQLNILEIMSKEQDIHKNDWLEEQKCANRVLLSTATQQAVPDSDQVRASTKREARTHLGPCNPARLEELLSNGGGQWDSTSGGNARLAGVQEALPGVSNCTNAREALAAAAAAASAARSAPPRPRARSQPKAGVAHAGAATTHPDSRRPSLLNPWDRPSGTIRGNSQFMASVSARPKDASGGFGTNGARPRTASTGRPGAAYGVGGSRPSSAHGGYRH